MRSLLGDGDAHGTGGTGDDPLGGLNIVGIEVGHLDLGDLGELLLGELADLVALGNARAALEAQGLLDQVSRRRSLADEVKGLVLVDGDLNGDNVAGLLLGLGIERLAELHDVDASGTKGGADGRRGVGGASGNLKLDEVGDLLLSHRGTFLMLG